MAKSKKKKKKAHRASLTFTVHRAPKTSLTFALEAIVINRRGLHIENHIELTRYRDVTIMREWLALFGCSREMEIS